MPKLLNVDELVTLHAAIVAALIWGGIGVALMLIAQVIEGRRLRRLAQLRRGRQFPPWRDGTTL